MNSQKRKSEDDINGDKKLRVGDEGKLRIFVMDFLGMIYGWIFGRNQVSHSIWGRLIDLISEGRYSENRRIIEAVVFQRLDSVREILELENLGILLPV